MQYIPSNAIFESLRRLFRRRIGDADPAYLGDGDGAGARVDVPGRPGYVYVRLQRTSPPFMARSGQAAYPNYPGAPVYVAYRYNGEPEIVGTNYKALDNVGIDTRVLNPLNQQSKWVYPYQLTYGLASAVATAATDSFLVTVKKFRHYVGNLLQAFDTPLESDKIDLEPYVPAADMHCYAAVWIDAFLNEAVVTTSVAQAITSPLDETDLQELVVRTAASRPPDGIPLKAFYLANAQGTLRQSELEVDLRLWLYNPPAWGFPNVLSTLERIHPNYTLVTGPFTTTGVGDLDTSETGAQHIIVHKSNMTATDAPDANDDSGDGYSIGSQWFDTSTGILYVASDVTVGAAVWDEVTSSASGGITELTGDVTAGPGSGSQVSTIANNAITNAKLATDSVSTSKIQDYAVELYKIAAGVASFGGPGGNVIGYDMNGNAFETPNAVDIPAVYGENLLDGDFAYFKVSDGKWWKIDADAGLIGNLCGAVVSAAGSTLANQPGMIRIYGRIDAYTGLTPGLPLYASNTPGAYSQTKPTLTAGGGTIIIAEMGMALSATEAFINPKAIEWHKREILDDGETLSITHLSDAQGRTRRPSAYVASSTIVLLETYATTNQDSAVQLKGQSGAGALVTVDSAGTSLAALGNNGSANFTLAQSIAVTAGYVSQATVSFNANTGSPVGTVTASLHPDDGTGKPSATTYESVVFTPTASSNNTITFAGTTFISGTVWLKLATNTTQASTVRWNVNYNNGNVYASGVFKADSSATPGTWATFGTTQDMRCSITTTALAANDAVGQGWSHASSTTLTYVDVYLKRTGTRTGDLTIEIQTDSAGLPSGTPITDGVSAVVLASSVDTDWELVRFTFSDAPSITGGTQYHFVLKTTDSADNAAYIEVGTDTSSPGYANGAVALLQSSSWAAASPAADACFAIYGVGTYYDQPIAGVGLGSSVLDAWYGDTSFANQNTTTTYENVYGFTIDVVGVVTIEKS